MEQKPEVKIETLEAKRLAELEAELRALKEKAESKNKAIEMLKSLVMSREFPQIEIVVKISKSEKEIEIKEMIYRIADALPSQPADPKLNVIKPFQYKPRGTTVKLILPNNQEIVCNSANEAARTIADYLLKNFSDETTKALAFRFLGHANQRENLRRSAEFLEKNYNIKVEIS